MYPWEDKQEEVATGAWYPWEDEPIKSKPQQAKKTKTTGKAVKKTREPAQKGGFFFGYKTPADWLDTTSVGKFLNRTSSVAQNTAAGDRGHVKFIGGKKPNWLDTASGALGTVVGFTAGLPGMGSAAMGYGVAPIANKAAQKTLTKLPKVSPTVAKYAPQAIEGAAGFGTYGLAEGHSNNMTPAETLKTVGENALLGAGMDIGGRMIGEKMLRPAFNRLKNKQQIINNLPEPLQTNEPLLKGLGANAYSPETQSKVVTGNKKESTGLWKKLTKLYTRTVDTQFPISEFSKYAQAKGVSPKVLASNSRNAQGITSHILENGLVNKEGQQIGESYKDLLRAIPKDAEQIFSDYLLHKHNIARMAQNKPVFGEDVSANVSMSKVAEYEALHPEFKELGGRLNKFIDDTMKTWGVDSGLITPEQYAVMKEMYPDYVPTYRSFSELEKGSGAFGKKRGFVGQTAGIKKATGSERDIIDPLESVMGLVDKTVKAAKYNEVGQNILNAVRDNPEGLKRWAEVVPSKQELVNDINKVLETDGIEGVMEKLNQQFDSSFNKPALDKDNIVRVMENGQPVYIKINDKDFLDAVKGLTQSDMDPLLKAARKGTGIFKSLITGKNPIFAIRNAARDIPMAYINGSESNPAKFLADLLSAGKDVLKKSPEFKEYQGLGGESGNFFAQDTKLLRDGRSLPGKFVGAIEKFNNITETVPRYAEYKRTVKRGGGDYASKQQGIFNANDVTTNFARSGNWTKSADAVVPYLNPAVQGLDKLVRQFKDRPIATVLKGATAITVPTLVLDHINKDNPDYKSLDNRTKDNYYVIPKGDGTFFKIPKSREMGVLFSALTERILRSARGESKPFKGFGNTAATNFSPANPIESNIFSPLMTNIPKNKDFANRTIVPMTMQDRSPRYQYDDQTSEIAKAIGDIANLSPKQIDYLIGAYTGVIGQLLLPATTKSNYQSGSTAEKLLKPITKQFIADPLLSNQAVTDFYDNFDELKQIAADRNFLENIPSKKVTPEEKQRNAYLKASKEISSLTKQIKIEDQSGNAAEVRKLRAKIIEIANRANSLRK